MTRWKKGQSGNPKGRPAGVERVRQLLEPHSEELVAKAVSLALAGDTVALRLCLERIAPPPRSEAPAVSIPGLTEAKSMTAKALSILDAVGNGVISPDTAAALLSAINTVGAIVESDEYMDRLKTLEDEK